MTGPESLTPEEAKAREAVGALSRPAADPNFRARLGDAFAHGTIEPARRRGGSPAPRRPLPWWRWLALPAAATALFVVAGVLNRGSAWKLSGVSGDGIAVVDGRPVPMTHVEELARLVRPGARLKLPEGAQAEIMSAGALAIQVTSGTDVSLPAVPGRWWSRGVRAEVASGELRITTGEGFRGARLAIATPEADVEVRGTTLAVICEPTGTCVCVLEGRVRVGARGGPMANVEQGMLRYVFNDARPPREAPMREVERGLLGSFREARRPAMQD